MSKYFVIVAGNGATSRANIEALMEDYYYAGGDGGTLLLPYTDLLLFYGQMKTMTHRSY